MDIRIFHLLANILNSLIEYISQYCLNIGHAFDANVIRLTAITGSAATEIKGITTHTACKIAVNGPDPKITSDDKALWKNTRLLVVDEISFAGYDKVLRKLCMQLQEISENYDELFGSIPILFIGDFLQLEPSGDTAIYFAKPSVYWEDALNMMVELNGYWRFKNCPLLMEAFPVYRKYGLTPELRDLFNSRVIGGNYNGEEVKMPDIRTSKVTTFHNKLRSEANDCIFLDHLKMYHSKNEDDPIPEFTVIIKARAEWAHNRRPLTGSARKRFFEQVREEHTRDKNKKSIDPLLKLFYHCDMMYKDNDDVNEGVANGTTSLFEYLAMKAGASRHKVKYNGYWVWAVYAEDVEYMKLSWSAESTFQGTFTVAPKTRTYKVELTSEEFGARQKFYPRMKITQFLVTVNHATTGHKLQGKTVDSLIVWEWSSQRNWIYVVLSRVKTLEGLFLKEPIPEDVITAPHPEYLSMMEKLRNKIRPRKNSPHLDTLRREYREVLRETNEN